MQLTVTPLSIPDVLLIAPGRAEDSRGYLSETFSRAGLAAHGVDFAPVQENVAFSMEAGVVRGLHAQTPPADQAKLVRVGKGRILDVAVDARRGSPTFGQWTSSELAANTGQLMYVPKGFLHGYATLEHGCEVIYMLDAPYDPSGQIRVRWDDPVIGIDWGLSRGAAILSPADTSAPGWAEIDSPFSFG